MFAFFSVGGDHPIMQAQLSVTCLFVAISRDPCPNLSGFPLMSFGLCGLTNSNVVLPTKSKYSLVSLSGIFTRIICFLSSL